MKDFNVLIDEKSFFEMPMMKKFEQVIEMGKHNDYPTGNLLDYKYFSKH